MELLYGQGIRRESVYETKGNDNPKQPKTQSYNLKQILTLELEIQALRFFFQWPV